MKYLKEFRLFENKNPNEKNDFCLRFDIDNRLQRFAMVTKYFPDLSELSKEQVRNIDKKYHSLLNKNNPNSINRFIWGSPSFSFDDFFDLILRDIMKNNSKTDIFGEIKEKDVLWDTSGYEVLREEHSRKIIIPEKTMDKVKEDLKKIINYLKKIVEWSNNKTDKENVPMPTPEDDELEDMTRRDNRSLNPPKSYWEDDAFDRNKDGKIKKIKDVCDNYFTKMLELLNNPYFVEAFEKKWIYLIS